MLMLKKSVGQLIGMLLAFVLLAAFQGCAVVERIGAWIDDNPVVAQIAVTQAVARYIEAGDSVRDIASRKSDTIYVINKTLLYLDGNPRSRVDAIIAVLNVHINWDALQPADRLLLLEVIQFVQIELEQRQDQSELPDDSALAIRSMLHTALRAAEQY